MKEKNNGAVAKVRLLRPSPRVLLRVEGESPTTTATYRGAVSAFVRWAKDHDRELGAQGLAEYTAALREEGIGASSFNLALYAGKAALVQAATRAGMSAKELAFLKGALDSLKGIRQADPVVKVVSPEERRRLLEASRAA